VKRMVKDKADRTRRAGDRGRCGRRGSMELRGALRARIQSRDEMRFRRLAEVAAFLAANEPQSPVSYLIERAVVWGPHAVSISC